MSMKNSNDIIGNRTHDLPACSSLPQPTGPPCAPDDISRDPIFEEPKTRMVNNIWVVRGRGVVEEKIFNVSHNKKQQNNLLMLLQ
jgi:hypothetical protein